MTHDPSDETERFSASEIAAKLVDEIDVEKLNNHQKSLFWDTVGLLGAVEEGILKSSPRVYSNLVEIVTQFDNANEHTQLVATLHSAILRTAEEGYSVGTESHGQEKGRWAGAQRDNPSAPGIS